MVNNLVIQNELFKLKALTFAFDVGTLLSKYLWLSALHLQYLISPSRQRKQSLGIAQVR